MSAIEYIRELAICVEHGFRAERYRQAAFPEAAARGLETLPAKGSVDPKSLVEAVLADDPIHPSGGHEADSVVPLYRGARFAITAHLWVDDIANPHSHRWNGAFQIASGSACHALYDFVESSRADARLRTGELRLRKAEHAQAGLTIPVMSGSATIHGLSHVERPSMSIAVRSYDLPDEMTLNYWRPGLVAELGYVDPVMVPKLRCLSLLLQTDAERYLAVVRKLVPKLHARGVFDVLQEGVLRCDERESIIQVAHDVTHLGELGPAIARGLEDMVRFNAFESARRAVLDADSRFVLGALYLSSNLQEVASFAKQRWPEHNALSEAMRVAAELSRAHRDAFGFDDDRVASSLARLANEQDAREIARGKWMGRDSTLNGLERHPVLQALFR